MNLIKISGCHFFLVAILLLFGWQLWSHESNINEDNGARRFADGELRMATCGRRIADGDLRTATCGRRLADGIFFCCLTVKLQK